MSGNPLETEWLGLQPYQQLWHKLHQRAIAVAEDRAPEVIYSCEHESVYTTGRRGIDNRVTMLNAPVVHSDRGGEMTYHGPGQVMLYPVIHLRARQIGVKRYVHLLEASCMTLLEQHGIAANRRCGFPGVWCEQGKIAALGVRVVNGVAFHGMALNVDVDPAWFAAIRPCGLDAAAISMRDFGKVAETEILAEQWSLIFRRLIGKEGALRSSASNG